MLNRVLYDGGGWVWEWFSPLKPHTRNVKPHLGLRKAGCAANTVATFLVDFMRTHHALTADDAALMIAAGKAEVMVNGWNIAIAVVERLKTLAENLPDAVSDEARIAAADGLNSHIIDRLVCRMAKRATACLNLMEEPSA